MIFEKTSFGNITIDGKKYNHDVYLFVDGTLQERDKSHSPHINGHRTLSEWELEHLLVNDPEILIIGMGQSGVLPMTDGVIDMIMSIKTERNVQVIQGKTPDILDKTNQALKSGKKVAGVFHTTC
ncbi:MAG: MTH938/NDUFAF3 family protein [Promethearchaeota archaeon]